MSERFNVAESLVSQFSSKNFLFRFGFDFPIIHEAVRTAWLMASMITRNHPRTYRGITFWAEFVKDFRQKLDNWTAQSIKNFDLTVNPQEDMAIVIMSGDKFTGLSGSAMPSTKNPKGAMTLQLVENNQLSLFPEMRENPIIKEGCQYWILLYYKAEDEIRLELSLPNNIDGEGKINSWLERIPLPSCKVGAGSTEPDITDKSSAIDFDIEIK